MAAGVGGHAVRRARAACRRAVACRGVPCLAARTAWTGGVRNGNGAVAPVVGVLVLKIRTCRDQSELESCLASALREAWRGRQARQEYVNETPHAIEAVYRFPVDERGAVCGFEAELEGRKVVGVVSPHGQS